MTDKSIQKQKFIDVARSLGASEDHADFDRTLGEIAKAPPPESVQARKGGVACKHCGSIWKVTIEPVVEPVTNGRLACVCGWPLKDWSGTRRHYEFELIEDHTKKPAK